VRNVSTSEVKAFWKDPTLWWAEFVIGRTLRTQPVALFTGIQWHLFMEAILNNVPRETALASMAGAFQGEMDLAISDGWVDRATSLKKDRDILLTAGELWRDYLDVETLAVEKALGLEVVLPQGGKVRLVGRQDRVVRFGGRVGHFQHRTLGMGKPVDPYLMTFHRNPYETSYWVMLAQEYDEEPFGTILSLVRKLRPESIRKAPSAALQQHLVPISKERAWAGVQNVVNSISVMEKLRSGELPLWFNPDNDLGPYANSLNPYVRAIIENGWDGLMDDTKFMPTKDRYLELADLVEGT